MTLIQVWCRSRTSAFLTIILGIDLRLTIEPSHIYYQGTEIYKHDGLKVLPVSLSPLLEHILGDRMPWPCLRVSKNRNEIKPKKGQQSHSSFSCHCKKDGRLVSEGKRCVQKMHRETGIWECKRFLKSKMRKTLKCSIYTILRKLMVFLENLLDKTIWFWHFKIFWTFVQLI